MQGHCLCGRVTFAIEGEPKWQAHCHCESCRRACSAPFTTFVGVADGQWRWTGAVPQLFASSPGVRRWFCSTCGSQMAFQGDRWPDETHFYAAALEDPGRAQPQAHVNWAEHLPWVHLSDGLPKQ